MRDVRTSQAQCKSILNRCPLDFAEWTLNPYAGCAFGCSYCYVPSLKAKLGVELPGPWGSYVDVKTNAAEVLRRQMRRVAAADRIAIGTATDPYQPAERRFRITRSVLEQLCFYENQVSIVTRSPLVVRDVDVLNRLADVTVSLSMPSVDDAVRRSFEPWAPAIGSRIEAVRRLQDVGIRVCVMWAPLLPGVADTRRSIRENLTAFAGLGAPVVVTGMRDLEWFAGQYREARAQLIRLRGPDSTQLYGGDVGQELASVAAELGVKISISSSLFDGNDWRRVLARSRPRNRPTRQARLVV
jgi:DNA repair photolyase